MFNIASNDICPTPCTFSGLELHLVRNVDPFNMYITIEIQLNWKCQVGIS